MYRIVLLFCLVFIFQLFAKDDPLQSLITRSNLQGICRHIVDQETLWDPKKVQRGDLIYVELDDAEWFLTRFHDQIEEPYILISSGHGDWVPHPSDAMQRVLYDPKLAAWFSKLMVISRHPKLFQLPMGQDYRYFLGDPAMGERLIYAALDGRRKQHLLYMNHFPRPNQGDRERIIHLFEDAPYCLSRNQSGKWECLALKDFLEEMVSCCFVLSPMGLEYEAVRTWEALALNTIPIVEHSFADPLYEDLPVLIVDDWDEIDEHKLKQAYPALSQKSTEKAFFPYWKKKILDVQGAVREGKNPFSYIEATCFTEEEIRDLQGLFAFHGQILYKGYLASVRPLQLAARCPWVEGIDLIDPWLSSSGWSDLQWFLQDPFFLQEKGAVCLLDFIANCDYSGDRFQQSIIEGLGDYALFLDLKYYRYGVPLHFSKDFKKSPLK